jgi:hypothetical protein
MLSLISNEVSGLFMPNLDFLLIVPDTPLRQSEARASLSRTDALDVNGTKIRSKVNVCGIEEGKNLRRQEIIPTQPSNRRLYLHNLTSTFFVHTHHNGLVLVPCT